MTGRLVLLQIHRAASGEAHEPGSGCPRVGGEAAAGAGIQAESATGGADGATPCCCGSLEAEEGKIVSNLVE